MPPILKRFYQLQTKASKPLFSKFNILSLQSLYKYDLSCFVFSHFNRLLPAPLFSILHFNRNFHDYLTLACTRAGFSWFIVGLFVTSSVFLCYRTACMSNRPYKPLALALLCLYYVSDGIIKLNVKVKRS